MMQGEFLYYLSVLCWFHSDEPQLQPRCFLTEINTHPALYLIIFALKALLVRFLASCLTWEGHGQPECDSVCQELDWVFTSAIENKNLVLTFPYAKSSPVTKMPHSNKNILMFQAIRVFLSPQSTSLAQHAPSVRMKVCSYDPFTSLL